MVAGPVLGAGVGIGSSLLQHYGIPYLDEGAKVREEKAQALQPILARYGGGGTAIQNSRLGGKLLSGA